MFVRVGLLLSLNVSHLTHITNVPLVFTHPSVLPLAPPTRVPAPPLSHIPSPRMHPSLADTTGTCKTTFTVCDLLRVDI
jgi:hypothetical protein